MRTKTESSFLDRKSVRDNRSIYTNTSAVRGQIFSPQNTCRRLREFSSARKKSNVDAPTKVFCIANRRDLGTKCSSHFCYVRTKNLALILSSFSSSSTCFDENINDAFFCLRRSRFQ